MPFLILVGLMIGGSYEVLNVDDGDATEPSAHEPPQMGGAIPYFGATGRIQ